MQKEHCNVNSLAGSVTALWPSNTSLHDLSVVGLSSVENPSTHGAASAFNAQSLPEAQSLLVNMTISDSMLNLYKDQNFDSCNLCVCNMNILGNDLGLYLPREKYEVCTRCTYMPPPVLLLNDLCISGGCVTSQNIILSDNSNCFKVSCKKSIGYFYKSKHYLLVLLNTVYCAFS